MRRMQIMMLGLVGVALAPVSADAKRCRAVEGPFTSAMVPPPECQSPIGMCTRGTLTGDLDATYEFTFETLVPANDPEHPTRSLYTGKSVITMDRGRAQLIGEDHGTIDFDPSGESAFVTTVMVVSGTKQYKGGSGYIVATGHLSFVTGQATGSYQGEICK